MKPKAVIFDVFGTCVDWRTGIAVAATEAFSGISEDIDALAFADSWRAKYQPAMEEIRSGQRPYTDLDILHRENLEKTLLDFGLDDYLDGNALAHLNRGWERLRPWPDTISGLKKLKAEIIIAPCSNGSIALTTHLSRFAGLPWDCVLGAGIARAYKPDPLAYLRSCEALQMEPGEVMMAAAHNDDLIAAREAGLKTMFFPRPTEHGPDQSTDLHPVRDWDIVGKNLNDAAIRFVAK